jgi:hypothetical protein
MSCYRDLTKLDGEYNMMTKTKILYSVLSSAFILAATLSAHAGTIHSPDGIVHDGDDTASLRPGAESISSSPIVVDAAKVKELSAKDRLHVKYAVRQSAKAEVAIVKKATAKKAMPNQASLEDQEQIRTTEKLNLEQFKKAVIDGLRMHCANNEKWFSQANIMVDILPNNIPAKDNVGFMIKMMELSKSTPPKTIQDSLKVSAVDASYISQGLLQRGDIAEKCIERTEEKQASQVYIKYRKTLK